jgi:hypothetical protein
MSNHTPQESTNMPADEDQYADIKAAFNAPKANLTPEQERAKKLETVRGLLAKAEGTDNPEEADAFRRRADQLMTQFAIDQWMVDQAQAGVNARPKPEIRAFNFDWWYKSDQAGHLWSLFCNVANHCRCVVATRGQGKMDGIGYYNMPVIGIPSDLDYFDLLFTHLMLQMGMQLEPKPDPAKSLEENAYALRRAGLNRMRVIKLLGDAGQLPEGWEDAFLEIGYVSGETYVERAERVERQKKGEKRMRVKVRVAAEKWAKEHELGSTTTVTPKVWQRSFARGFVREVGERLYAMRRAEDRPADEGPSVAIALRDIKQVAVELYDETWPDTCHGCGKLITECECKCPKCGKLLRTECEGHGRKSKAVSRTVTYDSRGVGAGREAGAKADLSGHQNRRVGGRKELEG